MLHVELHQDSWKQQADEALDLKDFRSSVRPQLNKKGLARNTGQDDKLGLGNLDQSVQPSFKNREMGRFCDFCSTKLFAKMNSLRLND